MSTAISEQAQASAGARVAPAGKGLLDWIFGLFRGEKPEPIPARAPAILHVTHWKAGSQWVYKILHDCTPERISKPKYPYGFLPGDVIEEGKVYPTLYATREQFDTLQLPSLWRRFVVIRDLRDTLISAYFSIKISHAPRDPLLVEIRNELQARDVESGLIHLMDRWLPNCAKVPQSWAEAGEPLIRYEDLLSRDLEILEPLLLDKCGLPVSRARFREVIRAKRFESLTNGRERGKEDVNAHERKGIAGDWRNYFNDAVKQAFKKRFGDLLITCGYEKNLHW